MQSMTDGKPTPEFKKFSDAVLALGFKPCRNTEVEFHFTNAPEGIMMKVVEMAKEAGYTTHPGDADRDYVEMYDSIYRNVSGSRSEEGEGLWNFSIFDGGEE